MAFLLFLKVDGNNLYKTVWTVNKWMRISAVQSEVMSFAFAKAA